MHNETRSKSPRCFRCDKSSTLPRFTILEQKLQCSTQCLKIGMLREQFDTVWCKATLIRECQHQSYDKILRHIYSGATVTEELAENGHRVLV